MSEPDVHCAFDEVASVHDLKPHPRNPNEHPPSQVRLLAKVIADTGWRAPITVSKRSGFITRGHGRLLAALHAGWHEVPVDYQEYASEAEELADLIADNKLAELSTLSADAVSSILQELDDPNLAGYQQNEVDLLLRSVDVAAHQRKAKEVALPKSKPAKLQAKHGTELGQYWASVDGAHALRIGDATLESSYEGLPIADAVFTDPPYGVNVATENASLPASKLRTDGLTVDNDDLDEIALASMLDEAVSLALASLRSGGAFYCCSPPGPLHSVFMNALNKHGVARQTIIWVKDQFVLGRSDYHYKHEPILYGWKPGAAHFYAPGDRSQDTVWEIDQLEQDTIWRYPRPKRSAEHPTMKPVELCARAIANSTRVGEVVLDPFAGSGSVAVAAAQLERRSCSIELDPAYGAVIIERLGSVGVTLTLVE